MDKTKLMLSIRRKKLGLLIRDARLHAMRSAEQSAQASGVDLSIFEAWETGETSPSFPQLEMLAYFYQIPFQHFWGLSALSTRPIMGDDQFLARLESRERYIADQLRFARDEAGFSMEMIAEKLSVPGDLLEQYENGEAPVPLPVIEIFCQAYGLDMTALQDTGEKIGQWHRKEKAVQVIDALPDETREFLIDPQNSASIKLAMQLSKLPSGTIRSIAESLLEMTNP